MVRDYLLKKCVVVRIQSGESLSRLGLPIQLANIQSDLPTLRFGLNTGTREVLIRYREPPTPLA
jgi:hypothetical protein